MEEVRTLGAFQGGKYCVSDGSALAPSEIKGTPFPGATINKDNEIVGNNTNSDCVGGVCPIR